MQEPDLNGKQNHYLTRLGISAEVQVLFYGTYKTDEESGDIYFEYSEGATERYSSGFHRLPSVPAFWKAGIQEKKIITEVIIGSSALDIIVFFSKKLSTFSLSSNLLFLASGARLYDSHFDLIRRLGKKRITLVFDDTFLGRISDIKITAAILNQPVHFEIVGEQVIIKFKERKITFNEIDVSLNTFQRAFKIRTSSLKTYKPKRLSFLQDQIDSVLPR